MEAHVKPDKIDLLTESPILLAIKCLICKNMFICISLCIIVISIHFSLYKNWLTAFWFSTLLFYISVRAPLLLSCSQEMVVPGRRTIFPLTLPDPSSWKAISYIYLVWQSHGILFSLVMMEISGWNPKECRSFFFFFFTILAWFK